MKFDVIKEEEAPVYRVYINKEELYDMYWNKNMSTTRIANELGCSQGSIQRMMNEYNVIRRSISDANRKYSVNEDFFKIWTHPMAYVLGEGVCADGSIHKDLRSFGMSSNDKELLEQIRYVMQSEHPIKKDKRSNNYCLYINSVEMVQDLLDIGITPNKSLNIEFPPVPEEYLSSFLRGEFDGDGSVCLVKGQNSIHVNITCASDIFTLNIQSVLRKNGIKANLMRRDGELLGVQIRKKSEVKKFYEFIYSTPGPYLKRKKDIFDKFFGVDNID